VNKYPEPHCFSPLKKSSALFFKLVREFTDPDTRKALQLRADVLSDPLTAGELLPQIAGLDEQELVQGIGYMSTWLGKSRAKHYSTWFGLPNRGLQEVSDVMDALFSDTRPVCNAILMSG